MDKKTNSNVKEKQEFIYFTVTSIVTTRPFPFFRRGVPNLLSLVNILQSELLGQFRPTVRCVQITSVTLSDYRHVILYNGSGFMPAKRCRKTCAEFGLTVVELSIVRWPYIMLTQSSTVQPARNLHLNTRHRDLPQRVRWK